MTDELTSLTLRLPTTLRERIEIQAKREDRSASQFVRFHLSTLLADLVPDEVPQSEEAAS
jgi:predicted DNA-binding protein